MSIVLFLVFGLVVGLVARALIPGRQSMSLPTTALLGVVGSFVGGFLASLVTNTRMTDLNTSGLLGSIIGAIVTMVVVGQVTRRSFL